MRLLIFILFLSPLTSFGAMKKYLVKCAHDKDQSCLIKTTQSPKDLICQVDSDEWDLVADDIKVEQVPINDEGEDAGFIERTANKIGLKNLETRTRCTVDTDKRQARLDSERAAREAEEQAREAERLKRVEAKAALRAMKGKVKDLTKDEMAEFLEKVIDLQAGE